MTIVAFDAKAVLTRLSDHQFGLCVEVATAVDLALSLLAFIVQHMMHFVVDHIVAEFLSLRALELSAHFFVRCATNFALVLASTGQNGSLTRV